MQRFTEGRLALDFPDNWQVSQYDKWRFYEKQFQSFCGGGIKGVDFLALDPVEKILWLIELKDFRNGHDRTKDISLWDEVAGKMRDTLAGLAVAVVMAEEAEEQAFAREALRATRLRVVLHLEQTLQPSRLFPRPFDPSDVQTRLKRLVRPIDFHPKVTEVAKMGNVSWRAQKI